MENTDLEAFEKKIGGAAAKALTASLRDQIQKTFDRRTGTGSLDKSVFNARYKDGRLDRLVMNSPVYSFTSHFGSDKKGNTAATNRKATEVRSFSRHLKKSVVEHPVKSHSRKGGAVKAHIKGIEYKAKNHIAKAFRATNALNVLSTNLGTSRAIIITSQIDF